MAKNRISKSKAPKKRRASRKTTLPIFPSLVRAPPEGTTEANIEAGAEDPSVLAGKKAAGPAKQPLLVGTVVSVEQVPTARKTSTAKKAPASAGDGSGSSATRPSGYAENPLEELFGVILQKTGFVGRASTYKSPQPSNPEEEGSSESAILSAQGIKVGEASAMLERANEVVGSIYWDLNCIAHFRKIVSNGSTDQDRAIYQNLCNGAKVFIDSSVHDYLKPGDIAPRCSSFTKRFGWRLFAICAHSEAFRIAFQGFKDANWAAVTATIADNQRSLQVYARTNGVEWRGPLLVHAQHAIPALRDALGPEMNLAVEHPHHTVRTLDGHLRRPRHQGKAQVNINTLHFSSEVSKPYPSSREGKTDWGPCNLCQSENVCDCRVTALCGDLVELVEYPNKGVGVRALTEIKEGEILGEYLGVVEPKEESTDGTYGIALPALKKEDGKWEDEVATLAGKELGNWARYMNHSCEASTWWRPITCGDRVGLAIVADRAIDAFEELTINYGAFYWSDDGCPCGSRYCQNPRRPAGESGAS